jgi:hypothetical protein
MAFIDKLKTELDRAGKAAQDAFDEGRPARSIPHPAARRQSGAGLGYAVYRAKKGGAADLDAETYGRLSSTLATHDAEAARLEAEIEARRNASKSTTVATGPVSSPS